MESRLIRPASQWATFRDDVEEISNRDRRPIMAIYEDPNQPEGWPRAIKANHQLLKWLITGWSLVDPQGAPRPLPRENGEVLEEIRARDYDLLIKAADDVAERVYADVKRVDPDPNQRGGSSNGSVSAPEVTPPSSTPAVSPPTSAPTSSAAPSAGP